MKLPDFLKIVLFLFFLFHVPEVSIPDSSIDSRYTKTSKLLYSTDEFLSQEQTHSKVRPKLHYYVGTFADSFVFQRRESIANVSSTHFSVFTFLTNIFPRAPPVS